MTKRELAAKHGVTEQVISDLRQAMSRCWGVISDDIEDYDGTLKMYKSVGENRKMHSHIWEARCVAEMTIDAGRMEDYGFEHGEPVPDWWKELLVRNNDPKWSIIDFGAEVWLAR